MNGGARFLIAQLQMASHEVGVEVSEEDMADLEPQFFRVAQILLNIALGIDDDRGGAGFVAQQVGGVGEAAQIILFQDHAIFYSLAFCWRRIGKLSIWPSGSELEDLSRRRCFKGVLWTGSGPSQESTTRPVPHQRYGVRS